MLDGFGALLEEIDADALMNDGAAGLLSQRTEEDETGVAQAGAAATQTTADDEAAAQADCEWLPKPGAYTPAPPEDVTHIIFVASSKTHAAFVAYARADPPQQWARVADVGGVVAETGHLHSGHTSLLAAHLWTKTNLPANAKVAVASCDVTVLNQLTRCAATSGTAVVTAAATLVLRDTGLRHHLTFFEGENPADGTLATPATSRPQVQQGGLVRPS